MKQQYQGSTRVKRAQLQALRKDYKMIHMKDGESVDEFFSRTLTVVNKITTHGERIGTTYGCGKDIAFIPSSIMLCAPLKSLIMLQPCQ